MTTAPPDTKVQRETLETVKIKLLADLPVAAVHGAKEGNVYDAEVVEEVQRGGVCYWITGATGERVGVLNHEAEVVGPSGRNHRP